MKLAVQLYSVREDAARDFPGTLARLAALGIDGVEFAGTFGMPAETLKAHLDRLGIVAASMHVMPEMPGVDFDEAVAYAKAIGCRSIVDPFAVVKTKTGIRRLAPKLAAWAKTAQAAGIAFGYHNHAHECFPVDASGKTGLDLLFELTADAGVFAEPDTHWLQRGKVAPRAFLRRWAGRVKIVHLKDLDATGQHDAAVGEGVMDIRGIWEAAEAAGAEWAVVELDTASFENVALGVANLKKMGLAR